MNPFDTQHSDLYPDTAPPPSDQPVLPHSIEAEQSVLGGLMLDASAFDAVAEVVGRTDFYKAAHRQIFGVMVQLQESAQPIDVITVAESLNRLGELVSVGGLAYLTELAGSVAGSANVAAYARIVRERSTLRQLIAAATEITKASYNPGPLGADDLLQLAEKKVMEIAEERPKEGGFSDVNTLLKAAVEKIDALFRSDSDITGVSTGLTDLNAKTSGWQPGELIILAARPSMGKTALALNFVESALMTQQNPCWFSAWRCLRILSS
jgi:replicative DNA helicase